MSDALSHFTNHIDGLIDNGMTEEALLPQVGEALRELVAEDNWLDDAFTQPHPEFYRQYLLHADAQDRYSVVSFVWGPGQTTPIHDHTVWGAIGMLRGAEYSQNYEIADDGTPTPSGEAIELKPGDVEFVSPTIGDVHKVSNVHDDQVSISIHIYGANIGKVKRHVFPAEGGPAKEFISGYSNEE